MLERWGPAVAKSARGLGTRLVEILGLGIRAWAAFRLGGQYARHPKEMPLQSRAVNVARQLHTVCCQAHALKLVLSQVVRLGHSAPP